MDDTDAQLRDIQAALAGEVADGHAHGDAMEDYRGSSRLLATVAMADPEHVVEVLVKAWPWTRALPVGEQRKLAVEVAQVAEMGESPGAYRLLLDVIADWRRTARAWAADDLSARARRGPGRVLRRPRRV